MPLYFVNRDITTFKVDACVNAANNSLLGGGGVDGAVHRAAGSGLLEECKTLGGCETGQAKITAGYNMPCKYIIHTVGPVWRGGNRGEAELLYSCYANSLSLAAKYGCESIAFPAISTGVYGYPASKAQLVSEKAARDFLYKHDMTIYFVYYNKTSIAEFRPDYNEINELVDADDTLFLCPIMSLIKAKKNSVEIQEDKESVELDNLLSHADESFSTTLLHFIDDSGMTDAECYRKANVDRRLFLKIRSDPDYRPGKTTVVAFALSLGLSLPQTEDLLSRAGFALSKSRPFDLIVRYYIEKGVYDIFEINEMLFSYDQPLIGG